MRRSWFRQLILAEHSLDLIAREIEHARLGRPARIIAKMNALAR